MARGPLPDPQKRRRNAPTIPTTELPAAGVDLDPPKPPYDLARAGSLFWEWAWGLPQAAAWDSGALYFVARRAQLEDDLAALEDAGDMSLGLAEALGIADERETIERVEWVIGKLKAMAGGKNSLIREMRELDNRLGLNPKGLADLRWTIVAGTEGAGAGRPTANPSASRRRSRLTVVA